MRILSLIILLSVFLSCKKELQPQDSSSTPNAKTDTVATASAVPSGPTTGAASVAPQIQPVAAGGAQPKAVVKGMNPPHGQPGHRCDIPVGASLSTPKKTIPAPASQSLSVNKTATSSPPAETPELLKAPVPETAPGMNPPHGQPGHKCEIPVGQPLNP